MYMTSGATALWVAVALAFVTAVITKAVRRTRIKYDPACTRPPPPVVKGCSMIRLVHTLFTRGFRAMIQDQYAQLGSVFTVSVFGLKATFLIGPEVSAHFYQGSDSEISHGRTLEFSVPMLGKEVGFGVDATTRYQQQRFQIDALKASKLRSHVGPMLQEAEDHFAKWGPEGLVDLKQELDQLLMLISGRCLLGKEVREMLSGEVLTLFDELFDNGTRMTSVLFPYAPTLATCRRNMARSKLSELFGNVVRSRKSSERVQEDALQNLVDSHYKDGRPTTEAEVTGMIMSLIFGGKHTSSTTSTWTGACLLSHTRWLAAAMEEQEQIIRKYGDRVDYNALQEMDILHCCIKEALRMHPPSPVFLRKVHKNFIVRTKDDTEYEIPKGHTIVSPLLFNNYIPHIYKDPDVFDPDRFGPAREEDKVGGKFSYTAFSGGRHSCPGEAYAYMQIKAIWSCLLRNFELELVSPFPETASWQKPIIEAKGKVMVSYKRRLPRRT